VIHESPIFVALRGHEAQATTPDSAYKHRFPNRMSGDDPRHVDLGHGVARELTALMTRRGKPGMIVSDIRRRSRPARCSPGRKTSTNGIHRAAKRLCRTPSARASTAAFDEFLNQILFLEFDHGGAKIRAMDQELQLPAATLGAGLVDRERLCGQPSRNVRSST
jgi:hypothetical protein